jgi:uncharacterized protein YbjQ (UPF0145 family)
MADHEDPLSGSAPPMVRPKQPSNGMTPIRYGDKYNLGYESRAEGEQYYVAPRGVGAAKKAQRYPLDQAGWERAWREFASREPANASDYLRKLNPPVEAARTPAPAVPLLTIPTIPGRDIVDVLGLVTASAVMSRNVFSDIGSDIVSVFGGNLEGIEKAISLCIEQVQQRMYERARSVGADSVVGLSLRLETVSDKAQAILMSGTAVRSHPCAQEVSSARVDVAPAMYR